MSSRADVNAEAQAERTLAPTALIGVVAGFVVCVVLAALAGWSLTRPTERPGSSATAPAPAQTQLAAANEVASEARQPEAARSASDAPASEAPRVSAAVTPRYAPLPTYSDPTPEVVRACVVHAVDLSLHDDDGLIELMMLGREAVPWAAKALLGRSYCGEKTVDAYVSDLASEDLRVVNAARQVLLQAGKEAVPVLRAAVADYELPKPVQGEGGVAVMVGGGPPSFEERAARLLESILDERNGTATWNAIQRRERCVRFLALHSVDSRAVREALAEFVGLPRVDYSDRRREAIEGATLLSALGALHASAGEIEDRTMCDHIAQEAALDEVVPRLSFLGELVYAQASRESRGEEVDWRGLTRRLEKRIHSKYVSTSQVDAAVTGYLLALVDAKPDVARAFLMKQIERVRYPKIRDDILLALCALADERTVAPLAKVGMGDDPTEAQRAVDVLGLIPGKAAYDAIVRALGAPTSKARESACLALMFRPRAVMDAPVKYALCRLLDDPSIWTGAAALGALVTPGWGPGDIPSIPQGKRLPARLYADYVQLRTASPTLEGEVRAATAKTPTNFGKLPFTDARYELPCFLEALAGRIGVKRWRGPSSLSPARVATWWRLQGADDRYFRWMSLVSIDKSLRKPLWLISLSKLALDAGRTDLVPKVILLLDSKYPFIRMSAAAHLRDVARGNNGFRYDASFAERAGAIRRWWAWWAYASQHPDAIKWSDAPAEETF